MHSSFKMWIVLWTTLLLQIWTLSNGQVEPEFKHELPPGVELVNPKDFGLTDDQLGGLLSNVKVLGGSQIGDTKTQILTVGFDGDEDLNFDDFEIPGLTDKKSSQEKPDKEKQIANVAFEKFKEFFKDPKKSAKSYESVVTPKPNYNQNQKQIATTRVPEPRIRNNAPQNQQYHQEVNPQQHQLLRPSSDVLQKHYPVTLTRPSTTSGTAPPPPPNHQHQQHQQHQQQQPPRRQQTNPQQQQQQQQQQQKQQPNHNYNSQPPRNNNNNNVQNHQSQSAPPVRQSSHAISFANNNQPSQNHAEFGSKVTAPATPATYTTLPQFPPPPAPQPQFPPPPAPQPQFPPVNHQQIHKHLGPSAFQNQVISSEIKFPATENTPPGNFQRFTIYPHKYIQAPSAPPTATTQPNSVGKVVRNQLLFNSNSNVNAQRPQQQLQQSPPVQHPPLEYRTIDQTQYPHPPPSLQNPASSSSSAVSSILKRFPDDPEQRPVSHVFIQHQNHATPVQQTSFHPRFQPPTRFVNDFTPSVNQITTPIPRFEVTPSMPMILISTNENAITDPKRMELLRQQQRQMVEDKKLRQEASKQNEHRQPHSLNYKQQLSPSTQTPYYFPNSFNQNQFTEAPRKYYQQHPPTFSPQNSYTSSPVQANNFQQYNKIQANNNQNSNNNQQQQNSFNFQTQQQQHQLHTLQQNSVYNNNNNQGPSSLPPRPYYQQQQQAQPSTNYQVQQYVTAPIGIQPPPPLPHNIRFQMRPESGQYYGARHKRGYRHRLTSILRGLWGDNKD